jgi:hypothetical protein
MSEVKKSFQQMDQDDPDLPKDPDFDLGPQHATSAAIALAYIGMNHLTREYILDAVEAHNPPRPSPVLAFRGALNQGIKAGADHFGSTPEKVLVDANLPLYEIPTRDEMRNRIDTEQWKHFVRGYPDEIDGPTGSTTEYKDLGDVNKRQVAEHIIARLDVSIQHYLQKRREISETEIIHHNPDY